MRSQCASALEVAQHRVALGIGLFEAIESTIVFTEPAQNQRREIRRHIVMMLCTRFEFSQAFARAVLLAGASVGIPKISRVSAKFVHPVRRRG